MKIPPSLAARPVLEEEVEEEEVLDEEVDEEVPEEVDCVQLAASSPGSLVEAPVGYEAMVAIPQLLLLFLDIMINP